MRFLKKHPFLALTLILAGAETVYLSMLWHKSDSDAAETEEESLLGPRPVMSERTVEKRLGPEDGYHVENSVFPTAKVLIVAKVFGVVGRQNEDAFREIMLKRSHRVEEAIAAVFRTAADDEIRESKQLTLKRKILAVIRDELGAENQFVEAIVMPVFDARSFR